MNTAKNALLTENAKTLRKSMTKQERHLWYDYLKSLPVTVNRQKVVGQYILDFYCAQAKIAIELDGSQHYDEEGKAADAIREAYLNSLGITVLRYSNSDITRNFEGVCEDILRHICILHDTSSDFHLKGKAFAFLMFPQRLPPRGSEAAFRQ